MATISKTLSVTAELSGQIVNLNWTSSNDVLTYFQHTYNVSNLSYSPIFESNVQTGNRTFDIINLRIDNLSNTADVYLKIYHNTGDFSYIVINKGESFVLSSLFSDNNTTAGGEKITKIEASASVGTVKIRVVHVS